eukprot:6205027-Pleurochrysis_carterae.AAC.4
MHAPSVQLPSEPSAPIAACSDGRDSLCSVASTSSRLTSVIATSSHASRVLEASGPLVPEVLVPALRRRRGSKTRSRSSIFSLARSAARLRLVESVSRCANPTTSAASSSALSAPP